MELTKEQKTEALKKLGWEHLIGYATGYSAPESENIIITVEEIQKWVGKPAEEYWIEPKYGAQVYDLEDAWISVCEDTELYTEDDALIYQHIMEKAEWRQ